MAEPQRDHIATEIRSGNQHARAELRGRERRQPRNTPRRGEFTGPVRLQLRKRAEARFEARQRGGAAFQGIGQNDRSNARDGQRVRRLDEPGPQPRQVLEGELRDGELHQLYGRRKIRADEICIAVDGVLDEARIEHRTGMQFACDCAEHSIRLQEALVAVEADEVVQIERGTRTPHRAAALLARRQFHVTQGGVRRDEVEIDMELALVGFSRGSGGAAEAQIDAAHRALGGVVHEPAESGRHRRDGEMIAHLRLCLQRHLYRTAERARCLRAGRQKPRLLPAGNGAQIRKIAAGEFCQSTRKSASHRPVRIREP
jgi:hypothetical protein